MKRSDVKTIDVIGCCYQAHNSKTNKRSIDLLQDLYPDYPVKILYCAMERDYDKGLLEYGVSLGTSWVTSAGFLILTDYTK